VRCIRDFVLLTGNTGDILALEDVDHPRSNGREQGGDKGPTEVREGN